MIDYGYKPDETVNVLVSVSGGRTSGYMSNLIQSNPEEVAAHLGCKDVKLYFMFANTGLENDDTLRFMDALDRNMLGGQVHWLEGEPVFGKRIGTQPRTVTYETCHRFGDWRKPSHPFVKFIQKYGIPNVKFLGCTRELKKNTINKYAKKIMGTRNWITAIGIREDERRRVADTHIEQKIFYPLVDIWPTDKQDVLDFWSGYDYDLQIPEWQGNCITCYKKSFKKLKQVWIESPDVFEFCKEMERRYSQVGPEFEKYDDFVDRTFWRGNVSTLQLIETFAVSDEDPRKYMTDEAGCSESCEMYQTELLTEQGTTQ